MARFSSLVLVAASLLFAQSEQTFCQPFCPPVSGNIYIPQKGLNPENLDWDSCNCKLYLGSLFNATGVEYCPYTKQTSIITFPGVTGNPDFHVGGVDYDSLKNVVYFGADAAAPFNTGGANLTGPNRLIRVDPDTHAILYNVGMAGFQATVKTKNGNKLVSGFQDMDEDLAGNAYYIATFGNAIARVSPAGVVSFYYAENPAPTVAGFSGIFSLGNKLIIADNSAGGRFVTFNTLVTPGIPTYVAPQCQPAGYTFSCDGWYAPPKYFGHIGLCSNNALQGIAVYRTLDNWVTTKYLGLIPNNDPAVGVGFPTATVQIVDSIYISEEYFFGAPAPNPDVFPLIDITAQVQALWVAPAPC